MPEDQAGAAMVRERGLPEPQPPATLAPAALPSPALMPRLLLPLPPHLVTSPSVTNSFFPLVPGHLLG